MTLIDAFSDPVCVLLHTKNKLRPLAWTSANSVVYAGPRLTLYGILVDLTWVVFCRAVVGEERESRGASASAGLAC